MEQFKLKSIDELDLEFVSQTRSKPVGSAAEHKSLIPEISKEKPAEKQAEPEQPLYFSKSYAPAETATYAPKPSEPAKKARPLVPIGQSVSSYTPEGIGADNEEDLDFSKGNYGEARIETQEKAKLGKGALAGKIISIVLLVSTVIVFVLGCFVSVFLDNNGSDIGGICFNTMGQDIETLGVSEGDLIISKKAEIGEYTSGALIAVPRPNGVGCDIQSVSYVNSVSDTDAELATTAMVNGVGYSNTIMVSSCYGIVSSYVPALGGLLSFAMQNAILVCVLFVLLAAFWCLILVLIGRSAKAEKEPKEPKAKKIKENK